MLWKAEKNTESPGFWLCYLFSQIVISSAPYLFLVWYATVELIGWFNQACNHVQDWENWLMKLQFYNTQSWNFMKEKNIDHPYECEIVSKAKYKRVDSNLLIVSAVNARWIDFITMCEKISKLFFLKKWYITKKLRRG